MQPDSSGLPSEPNEHDVSHRLNLVGVSLRLEISILADIRDGLPPGHQAYWSIQHALGRLGEAARFVAAAG